MELKSENESFRASPEMQLTKLSSVLNGLEQGASAMRHHAVQAKRAVQSGTYTIDASAVSRSIIGECVVSGSRSRGARETPPKLGS